VRIRESKFGPALVVECVESCGGYVLGFRIDPKEKLQSVHKELLSLQKIYGQVPLFGVQFKVGEQVGVIVTRLQQARQETYTT
jgi:Bardet-Biedl syndrome 5 protein